MCFRNHAQRPYLTSGLRDRNRDRLGVDIQPDKTYVLHDRLLRIWLCVVQCVQLAAYD